VTVLFADVANFTALSEKLDPEEVHGIMDGASASSWTRSTPTRARSTSLPEMGSWRFSAPLCPRGSCSASLPRRLSAQNALDAYAEKVMRQFGAEFKMRMGLHSAGDRGIHRDDLRMDYTAIGDTTNLAARIQQPLPRAVWVSQETHHMIQNYFHDEFVLETP